MTSEPKPAPMEVKPGTWIDLLLYMFLGFGLYLLASALVAIPFQEINLTVASLAILMNILFIGGSAYVLGIRRGKITWASLGISPPIWEPIYLVWAFVIAIGLMPIRGVIGMVIEYLVEGGFDNLQMRSDLLGVGFDNWAGALILFFGIGILAPISEELFFRGLIYTWLRQRTGIWASALLSSAWFALGHIDSVGVLVSSFLMGVVIAWVFERSKSLWLPIAIHVITNSVSVLLLFVAQAFADLIGV